ncbi:hypothetical protein LPJ59_004276 [Coemansia sp. RSA 2399]|nr:hypothetical protein LPJ59_004276 [Coemansia sp. RSA 2399]KAJ1900164.1 hypothetical protein LPJ81_003999 [Coemansia sp. IMI 209127]
MSLAEVSHYTVRLFSTSKYDGLQTSVFHVRKGAMDAAKMLDLSAQSTYQHNMFLTSNGECYWVRCFSRTTEIAVPPLWAISAAPLVSGGSNKRDQPVHIVAGNKDTIELPDPSSRGHIHRAVLPVDTPYMQSAESLVHERIVLTNILGWQAQRRQTHVQVDYVQRTMVIYHSKMTTQALQALAPTHASLTPFSVDQLRIDTVVVCVPHKSTGGLFVRAFLPMQAYAEALMPVQATPCLRHPWAPVAVQSVFEISWVFADRQCRLIKRVLPQTADKMELLAGAEATLERTIYV